jgi:hypothetical protein
MPKQKTFTVHHPIVRLISHPVHKLEYDPVTQFKFNFSFTWLWALCIVALPFFPVLYQHNLASLIIQELSIWALFISHFTAVGSAIAGIFAANREDEVPSLRAYKLQTAVAPTNKNESEKQNEYLSALEPKTQPSPSSEAQAFDF